MARFTKEFVKLETRLINDHRFFSMSEFEQLTYLKLLAISRITRNKIPKDFSIIGAYLRTNRSDIGFYLSQIGFQKHEIDVKSDKDLFLIGIESAINRIKENFPKFKENKYFYYFDGYTERFTDNTHNEVIDIDIDKDLDKDKDIKASGGYAPPLKQSLEKVFKEGFNIYALITKLQKESKIGAVVPDVVLLRVCERYQQEKGTIKSDWAWFKAVVVREWQLEQHNDFKKAPPSQAIKDIMKNL